MIILTEQIKHELTKEGRYHHYLSPVWVLYHHLIEQDGKTMVRVSLVKNQSIESLSSITFWVESGLASVKITTHEFKESAYVKDHPIFMALFECPKGLESSDFKLEIATMTLGNQEIDLKLFKRGPLNFPSLSEDQLRSMLSIEIEGHVAQMPEFTPNYWQCVCHKYNGPEQEVCANCAKTREYNRELVEVGFNPAVLERYLSDHPITALPDLKFEKEYLPYKTQLMRDLGLTEVLLDKANVKERVRKDYDAYATRIYGPLRRSTTRFFIGLTLALSLLIFIGVYGGPYLVGRSALNQKNYPEAINVLMKIEDFADSAELITKARIEYAQFIALEDPVRAMAQLETLDDLSQGDLLETYNQIVTAHASQLFEAGEYEHSALYFAKIDDQKSADMANECYYRLASQAIQDDPSYDLAMMYLNEISDPDYKDTAILLKQWPYDRAMKLLSQDEPEAAIALLESLGNYMDAIQLKEKTAYEQARLRYDMDDYNGAIVYFTKSGLYLDSSDWLRRVNYQIGDRYLSEGNDAQAYIYLVKASGYKDADAKAKAIEEKLYVWDTQVWFNSDENDTTDLSSILRKDPVYIHFKLIGGPPGEVRNIKLWYSLPNGNTGTESYESILSDEANWLAWDEGIYIDASSGDTGPLIVKIYDADTGSLLIQDSVEITK